jgi:hypothetical protein
VLVIVQLKALPKQRRTVIVVVIRRQRATRYRVKYDSCVEGIVVSDSKVLDIWSGK